jgi:hypothetical protein
MPATQILALADQARRECLEVLHELLAVQEPSADRLIETLTRAELALELMSVHLAAGTDAWHMLERSSAAYRATRLEAARRLADRLRQAAAKVGGRRAGA